MNKVWTIFGTGAHARKAFHIAVLGGDRVAAFIDEQADAQPPVPGVPVLTAASGWRLPPLLHPSASVAPDAVLGEGVMVAAGAVVESGTHIGRGCIVDIGVLIDHDCEVAAFTHLRPGQVCAAGTRWPA